ncbi:MAG: Fic family protein [Phycisphaerae bacterium]|jgi:fido (protein-threonine AMPylation protein)
MDSTNSSRPWYYDYEEKVAAVAEAKCGFRRRCTELELEPVAVMLGYTKEIVASAVHESNWQEGVEVSIGRTRELADVIFADFQTGLTPGLDLGWMLENHRKLVLTLKNKGISENDLITLNLSAAYKAVTWLLMDIQTRYNAILAKLVEKLAKAFPGDLPPEAKNALAEGRRAAAAMFTNEALPFPVTNEIKTGEEFLQKSGRYETKKDLEMLEERHIHFLHRLLFTGIFPSNRCGSFRRCFVNLGRQDLFLPPPDTVPALMADFVKGYPLSAAFGQSKDVIMEAAKFSHRFTAIHPYNDGNGRISRALMNLVLCGQHPFVALKATNQKSRSRYYYALRRADRGDLKPLAGLIALSLVETYNRILGTLGAPKTDKKPS